MSAFSEEGSCLKFSGAREVVNSETAQRLIQEWQASNTAESVTHVNLSNKCYTSDASVLLADILSSLPTNLIDVNLSDIIASRPEDDALITLNNIGNALQGKEMKSVNLSDNALGRKGIAASRPILESKALEHLYLCNVGLSKEACELVAEILTASVVPAFKTLHFYNNMSGSGGAAAIATVLRECHSLKDFRFSATRSSSDGCLALADSLAAIHNLNKLDLSDNTFGAQAAKRLGEALRNHATLVHANFRDDGFTDKGIKFILSSLADVDFPALTFLDLAANDITDVSVGQLMEWVVLHAPAVQTLHFDDNDLGTKGALKLSKQLENLKNLKLLTLNTCEIGGRGALAVARAVVNIEGFERLEMDGNSIPAGILDEIQNLFENHGKTLGDMDENNDDEEEEEDDEEDADEED